MNCCICNMSKMIKFYKRYKKYFSDFSFLDKTKSCYIISHADRQQDERKRKEKTSFFLFFLS